MLGLGEVATLNAVFDPLAPPDDDETIAKFRDSYQRFWRTLKDCYEERSGERLEECTFSVSRWRHIPNLSKEDIARQARSSDLLFLCAHMISETKWLVDASKRPPRLIVLERSKRIPFKVIHLIRDGRAVINSYLKV